MLPIGNDDNQAHRLDVLQMIIGSIELQASSKQ